MKVLRLSLATCAGNRPSQKERVKLRKVGACQRAEQIQVARRRDAREAGRVRCNRGELRRHLLHERQHGVAVPLHGAGDHVRGVVARRVIL